MYGQATTIAPEENLAATPPEVVRPPQPLSTRRDRRAHVVAVSLVVGVVAVTGLSWMAEHDHRPVPSPSPSLSTSVELPLPGNRGATLPGHEVLRGEKVVYGDGVSRPWGAGDGLHQVTVLSGALSVDDGQGHTHVYRAGEGYVAGWAPYTARSAGGQAAETVVSYLGRSEGRATSDDPVPSD